MARITDQKKIERLKVSTMKLVAENGYGGASAALITTDAKVASGYFYLHYKGKYELVNSLLSEIYQDVANKLNELISEGSSFDILIENVINYFCDMANNEPVKIKFFQVLSNDYRFKLEDDIRNSMFEMIEKIMNIGSNEGLLDTKLTREDIFLHLVINTIQHINQCFKYSTSKTFFSKKDRMHMLYLVNKTLK